MPILLKKRGLHCSEISDWIEAFNKVLAFSYAAQHNAKSGEIDPDVPITIEEHGEVILMALQSLLHTNPKKKYPRCSCAAYYCTHAKEIALLPDCSDMLQDQITTLRTILGLPQPLGFLAKLLEFCKGVVHTGAVPFMMAYIGHCSSNVKPFILGINVGLLAQQVYDNLAKRVAAVLDPENQHLFIEWGMQALYPDEYDRDNAQKWGKRFATACIVLYTLYLPLSSTDGTPTTDMSTAIIMHAAKKAAIDALAHKTPGESEVASIILAEAKKGATEIAFKIIEQAEKSIIQDVLNTVEKRA